MGRSTMTWEAKEEDVLQFIAAMNRREVDHVARLVSDELRFSGGPRFGAPVVGRKAFEGLIQRYFREMIELLLIPREIFFDGNEAVAVVQLIGALPERARDGGREMDVPRRVAWTGVYRFVFDDRGRARELRIYGARGGAPWLPEVVAANGPVARSTAPVLSAAAGAVGTD
jgi:hypothetical protein